MKGEPLVVLLIEDDEAHAALAVRSLRQHFVENVINRVHDGGEALAYLGHKGGYSGKENSPRPHVILLDLRLPKIDGLEVLKTLKKDKKLRDIPVVVLTSSDSELDIAKACEYQADSYMVKPLDFDKFAVLMRDLGFCWLCWSERPYG